MPDVAFLFPGQGSQRVGMVQELASYPEALESFQRASQALDFDLLELCLRGPEEELSLDFNAQVAVHVTNCAYASILKRLSFVPQMASGFSLGIFSALVAAESLTFDQGLEGVIIAAEKMSEEGLRQKGAMAAVIGLSVKEVQQACREASQVYLASVNNTQQLVISGQEEGVEKAIRLCIERGALLVKRLPIGWAIHTPLMERASQAFAQAIQGWEVTVPQIPVLSYLTGELLRTPEEIKEELSIQFSRPNHWHRVLLRMVDHGIDTFVEVGPGNVLTQMVRWVNRRAKAITAEEILKEGLSNAELGMRNAE
ncbi:MAG: ACP S-malonyltransferase [Syntrophaceae bacterium]|nr:ACP S-malonyltransferase [Syntrophaceae bacterium]